MRFVIDIEPLRRYPQFRWLWLGYLVSQMGSQLTKVAVMYEIFELTHSSLMVGLISFVQLFPALFGSLIGGALADAVDRRRLLLVSQLVMAAATIGLAVNSMAHHASVPAIFALSTVIAAFTGVDSPTRTAVMMTLVDRAAIPKANTLRQLILQCSQVVGPAVAGVLLATTSLATVYLVDAVSFAAAVSAVLILKPLAEHSGARRRGLNAIAEGFRFLRGRPAIQGCLIADLNATVFGMPIALFPALGIEQFHGGAQAVGYLNAAPGVGALIGALLVGWTPRVKRPGRAVLIATAVWGLAITIFGLTPWLPVALFLLAIAGLADVISSVFRGTILQLEAPDHLRGRLTSIHTAVVQGGPRLGNTEAGVVAAIAGSTASVVSGGIICVLGSYAIARLMPKFTNYELPVEDDLAPAAI